MFVQRSFLTRFYKSVQQRPQTSHGTDAFVEDLTTCMQTKVQKDAL